jgi:hypothetical protein
VWGWGGGELGGFGPQQTDKHLPQSPFTGIFLDDDIFLCLLESYLGNGTVNENLNKSAIADCKPLTAFLAYKIVGTTSSEPLPVLGMYR